MKILVITQYYYPEPFRITDICEELVRQGHEVKVVTGTPNYPMGEIYLGYDDGKRADEIINGVSVHRCKTAPRRTGTLNRLRNYFSYARISKKYVKMLPGDYDVAFVYQMSPVMMAEAAIAYKKKYHKKMVLYCLDLWPESLCVGGVKKESFIYMIFKSISKRIYRSADTILITSKMFREYLTSMFGVDSRCIYYLPQYAEEQFLDLKEKEITNEFHLLFAGNIGVAQSINTIIDAARILRDEKIVFHIVGDGTEIDSLREYAMDLPKVIFYGRRPLEEMPMYYEKADAMLVTLVDNPIISMTLPGKVQTYMAAGKPIVGAINGETALVLNEVQGGYCGPAGDAKQLAENIVHLMHSGVSKKIGENNFIFYSANMSKKQCINNLLLQLKR